MSGTHKFYKGVWEIECRDKDGNVRWAEVRENALVDQGENYILNLTFRNLPNPAPTSYWVGMCNDTLDQGDTLSTLMNEPVGNGYIRQGLTRDQTGWPVIELDQGDYQVVSQQVQFQAAGGSIGPVNTIFLCTVQTGINGLLIAFVNLTLPRTLLDGDSLLARYTIKLQ